MKVVAPGIVLDPPSKEPAPNEEWVTQILRNLAKSKFYGNLGFTFVDGSITVARVDQSIRPPTKGD